jgi:hypothetical protein
MATSMIDETMRCRKRVLEVREISAGSLLAAFQYEI